MNPQNTSFRARTALVAAALAVACAAAGAATDGLSVVFIGNSITRHGPAPAIQWTGDWGMAASSKQTDYAGQVVRRLQDAGHAVNGSKAFNIAAFEKKPLEVKPPAEMLQAARASDVVVIELGDNVDARRVDDFAPAYARLLEQARPAGKGRLLCLSTWWKTDSVDAVIKPACEKAGGSYVPIGDIQSLPGTHPSKGPGFSDPGVLRHPGDAGMAEIAARLVAAWQKTADSTPPRRP